MVKKISISKKQNLNNSTLPKNYSLQNTSDFLQNIDENDIYEYLNLFNNLIKSFIELSCTNITVQNADYFKFIILKGLRTINHIFLFLIMYTKNISIVGYFCQKGFYYYNEFIGQIDDINHSYLQLTSKDATIFVYKKTIFEINNDYRKNCIITNKEKEILLVISNFTNLYIKFFDFMFTIKNITNKDTILLDSSNITSTLFKKIVMTLKKYDKNINNIKKIIDIISILFNKLKIANLENKFIYNTMAVFCKKLSTIDNLYDIEKKIINKLNSSEFDNIIKLNSSNKIITYIVQ